MLKKIIAVDLGTKYIGIAASDPEQNIAFPVEVVAAKPRHLILKKLEELARVGGAAEVLVGRPLSLAGHQLPMTRLSEKFSKLLGERLKIKVRLVDERLSTKIAKGSGKTDARLDARAAAVFLQNYLDSKKIRRD